MNKVDIGNGIICTETGWGEVVELLSHNQFLVEFPNKKRRVYSLNKVYKTKHKGLMAVIE